MTAEERVRAAMNFERPDRVPYWDSPWDRFVPAWQRFMNVAPEVLPQDYYHSDILMPVPAEEQFWVTERRKLAVTDEYEIVNDGWGREVRIGRDNGVYFSETLRRDARSMADLLDRDFDSPLLSCRYEHLADFVAGERKAQRPVFAKIGGLYCRSQFARGEAELLMDMLLEPEATARFFQRVAQQQLRIGLEVLRRTEAWENGLFVYDDMAGTRAPMFGPELFARFLLEPYRWMIGKLKAAGCRRVCFHSDGNILPLLDLLLEAGFEGFNPLEPRCGLDLVRLRERYGRRFIMFGGVCNTVILPRGDRREIEHHVRPLLELARDGGIVLGCASVGEDVAPEVYDWYRKMIEKYR